MATLVEDLPDELLLQILDLLPNTDLIYVVPFVCLRWWRLSLDSHIWKNRTYFTDLFIEDMMFFSRKPALRTVVIVYPIDDLLRMLASHCPTITSLRLYGSQRLTLDTLRLITRNCDQIRDLDVPSEVLSCSDCAREVALMPRLETLTVGGSQELQLRELGAGCARLRHLNVGSANNFRLGDLGAPLLRRIQGLTITWKLVSRDIVHCAESLEKLSLRWDYYTSRPEAALAEDLLSLKALTHVDARFLSTSPQIVRSLMQPLLQSLNLSDCSTLTDDLLLELCRRCPLLEDLNLCSCDLITAPGLSSMWRLRRLRRLVLTYCEGLGSGAAMHLARCDGLQELRVGGVELVRMEPGVTQLLELSKLRVLVFSAWSARDLIPWEMFPNAFPDLRILYLGNWAPQDTSLPESLKAAMPTVDVKWFL